MDTSVPRQRDTSDSALVDMLMLEAPVGLALFGPDMRFRWVNAALTRLGRQAGSTGPSPTRRTPAGPAQPGSVRLGGPAAVASVAGADRHQGGRGAAPCPGQGRAAGRGRLSRALTPPYARGPARPALMPPARLRSPTSLSRDAASARDVPAAASPARTPDAGPRGPARRGVRAFSGCASWFPVHDASGQVFGVGLIMLNMAARRRRPPRRPRPRSGAARSVTARWSWAAPRWSGWRRRTAR